MLDTIKKLLGFGPGTDYAELAKNGAIILDVRSKTEFAGGHVRGSVNIPVNELTNNLSKLKDKNKTIITCCASGMRSASAKSILAMNGYTNVYNGGSWSGLKSKINS
ncbi:MAG: rhodanese-like domain-containing protein [Bacteroidia bacterium]